MAQGNAAGALAGAGKFTELRQRLLFVLGALIVYRIGCFIPVPGVNPDAMLAMMQAQGGGIVDMFNMFSGGALHRFSIFALNVMPYISASIVMQLGVHIFPTLKALQKEGESGRRKITQYSRIGAVLLAVVQGGSIATALQNQVAPGGMPVVYAPGMGFVLTSTAVVMQLLAEPGFDDPAVTGSLGGVGFGGAGLPQRLIDDVLTRRSNSMSGIGYGLTETNGVCAAASGQLFQHHPQAAGSLSPIIELRVVDLDGTDLPPGQAGEVWLRGVSLMQGYLGATDGGTPAQQGGWFRTGDIGILDAHGLLRVVDRIKDVINRAGEKIAAAEVESCLLQHPALTEAAVFSQPDEQTGEAVVAVVVLAPGAQLTPEQVQAHVASRLAAYKVPQRVHVRTELLPPDRDQAARHKPRI
mgnify:CR=1 FL=1